MGQKQSNLSPTQLRDLRYMTQFTDAELRSFHEEFVKINPSGRITREEMMRQYLQIFPGGDPTSLIDQLFSVYDVNEDGTIDFREFICGMGLMTHGTPEQKLHTAFRMCDLDNNGCISKRELESVITAIYHTLPIQGKGMDKNSVISMTNSIFENLDKDNDEKISFEEFIAGVGTNPEIILLLETMSS